MSTLYKSTRSNSTPVTASQAILKGLCDDGGLFVPTQIPTLLASIEELAKMDYKEVGGSSLMGVRKPVIKAHGSSDSTAFFNAIRQAKKCVDVNVTKVIEDYVSRNSI